MSLAMANSFEHSLRAEFLQNLDLGVTPNVMFSVTNLDEEHAWVV